MRVDPSTSVRHKYRTFAQDDDFVVMFKKKKTYVILVIIIAVVGSVFYFRNKKPVTQRTTQTVQSGDLFQTVSVTGKIIAPQQASLSFKAGGRIEELYVAVGDHVTKGQKIAKIDRGTLNAQLLQAQAGVKAQKETLDNMKRKKDDYTTDQRDTQRAEIVKAEAAVAAIANQLKELVVYAPFDGTVVKKGVERGETITANSTVVTIAQDGDLELESNVPESDIIKVDLGQKAEITLDAFSSEDKFSATVSEIEPAATVIQDVVYYKIKLKFDNPDARFKNGMSADIDIRTAEKKGVIFVPMRAVKTENGQKYVEILKDEKNGVTEKINVTTGMEGDDGMVEIKSDLVGGERVVTLTKTP